MKALMLVGKNWVKVVIVAWVPGSNDAQPQAIYHIDSDKEKTLHCAPLYRGTASQFRAG